jgi:hypothetical protein
MPLVFSPVSRKRFSPSARWERFDARRTTKTGGDFTSLYENFVVASWPGGSTLRDIVELIARNAKPPIPIDSLDLCLEEIKLSRGGMVASWTGDRIDETVLQYPGLRWWISRRGLVIGMIRPEDLPLSEFDRTAGELMRKHFVERRLSCEGLAIIAAELDKRNFTLKCALEPSQWKKIADCNQRNARNHLKSFAEVVKHPKFVRLVRKRLSRARERFEKRYQDAFRH